MKSAHRLSRYQPIYHTEWQHRVSRWELNICFLSPLHIFHWQKFSYSPTPLQKRRTFCPSTCPWRRQAETPPKQNRDSPLACFSFEDKFIFWHNHNTWWLLRHLTLLTKCCLIYRPYLVFSSCMERSYVPFSTPNPGFSHASHVLVDGPKSVASCDTE